MWKLNYEPESLKLPGLIVNSHSPIVILRSSTTWIDRLERWVIAVLPRRQRKTAQRSPSVIVDRPSDWGVLI